MAERSAYLSDDLRYQLLKMLEASPNLSQRELAGALGISVGKVNYCVKALVRKGWVKARNFKNSRNKLAYTYYLTPRGLDEKSQLAIEFLKIKLREVEGLRAEIAEMQRQARGEHGGGESAAAEE
ncbi:MAG TPA: MarR family EPS-associated transcriptional regulator [Thermoanaerobaculia bacterium]|nr:MarR family EPS-associated transcriptional regulator [Thermoanaerobaculia bacterium]